MPALAQDASAALNNVPATARQAAASPAFAQRLYPSPARASAKPAPGRGRRVLAQDQVIYNNGLCSIASGGCTTDAWTINFGYAISDSLTVSESPATGFDFVLWAFPGDQLSTVDWSITSAEFGGTTYGSGTATATLTADQGANQYGYEILTYHVPIGNVSLNAGMYYLNLQNAVVPSGDPIYWDENGGPSIAAQNNVGTIPSESFDVTGSTSTVDCSYYAHGGFKLIHDFTDGEDGGVPNGLVIDNAGNLEGTTWKGGAYGAGTAFRMTQNESGWVFTNLYDFPGGSNGPPRSLALARDGTLYGSADGGLQNCYGQYCGFVFNLRPQPTACYTALCAWTENILYAFKKGSEALFIVGFDGAGNLYGYSGGGGAYGKGAVYKLTHSDDGWALSVVYSFSGSDGADVNNLLVGTDGNLYGTAYDGGPYGNGVLFQLVPSESGWTENTIVAVGDPDFNVSHLAQDQVGNLYMAYQEKVDNPYGPEWAAAIAEFWYSDGQWKGTLVAFWRPYDWESEAHIVALAAGLPGNPAYEVYAYSYYLWPYGFLWNRFFAPGGEIDLGASFEIWEMWGDTHTYPERFYGTTSDCGKYQRGAVWEFKP